MGYVLATTETTFRWYYFPVGSRFESGVFELKSELILNEIPHFGDKKAAKEHAVALGLKTWRYVKI